MREKTILTILSAVFAAACILSCTKASEAEPAVTEPVTGSETPVTYTVLGKKLDNPYSIGNMRKAYRNLTGTRSSDGSEADLEPNSLYVRFLPKDSTDVRLLDETGLELFDYPLDYDIVSYGDTYHDPSVPEGMPTWQYTCVKPDFAFPNIEHEILDYCYIPNDGPETRAFGDGFAEELELTAIQLADLPEKYRPAETRGLFSTSYAPKGRFCVWNDWFDKWEGVKCAKVRCNYLVKISSVYMNEGGYYTFTTKFACNPHYSIVYENKKDFMLWDNWSFVSAATHDFGHRSKEGFSFNIARNESAWVRAVVNNAAYDYYCDCEINGIKTPPSDLKIWLWSSTTASSASMLHHLKGFMGASTGFAFISALAGAVVPSTLVTLGAPDLTIGIQDKNDYSKTYADFYTNVWHELCHASHFMMTGESFWGKYINYIVKNGKRNPYGSYDESTEEGRICTLGETLAYSCQETMYLDKFGKYRYEYGEIEHWYFQNDDLIYTGGKAYEYYNGLCRILIPGHHETAFNPTWTVYLNGIGCLSRKQIYDCLSSNVKSVKDLIYTLKNRYPQNKTDIENAFPNL
jgi:hypothetical protein